MPKAIKGSREIARLTRPQPSVFFKTRSVDARVMKSDLIQRIYASAASRHLGAEELKHLLRLAQLNNARLGLTGMLLYAEGSFFQVLEGRADVVHALYAKIEHDPRHEQMTVIIDEPIPRRYFDAWTMGFCKVSSEELAGLVGVNDFFGPDRAVLGCDAGRARKLLTAFRDGRWRMKLAGARSTASA